MKRFTAVLLLVALSVPTLESVAYADPAVETIPAGEDKISPLRQGDPAPFSGQLFDQSTSLRWANWLTQYKFRLKADVDLQKKIDQADVDLLLHKLQLQTQLSADFYKRATDAETELKNPPWYRTGWFYGGLGVLATTAALTLTAFAVHNLK